jgi:hypothetical protein
MSNGNSNLPQSTEDLRKSVLSGVKSIYDKRYEVAQPQPEQEGRPSLSSYSQDIQELLSGNAVRDEYRGTQREAMEKLLGENNIDSKSFFNETPEATVVDVMRRTNFEGFADKERAYSLGHSTDYGRDKALNQIQEEFSNRFDNSLVFPDLGVKINEYIPNSIREDDRKRGDFEKAFYQETGIALDFDGSNRVGDMYVEGSGIGNAFREAGYLVSDLGVGIMDATLGTAEFFYDMLGGDINKANKEFTEKQESGEMSTQLEAAEGSFSKGEMDLFWASFTSSEARRQLVGSKKSRRTIDFQAMQDRNEYDTSVMVGNSVDMLVESAPLLLDLALGSHGGSFLMKGATKAVAKQTAKKIGTRVVGKSKRFIDPKTNMFVSKATAEKVIKNSNTVQRLLNQGGAVVVSDLLVASQMHSDNVGQEWYDNLSGSERASYLAQQSTAEVLSGMVLNNVLGRGFFGKTSKSKVTQEGWKARKKFVTEYGKNIVDSTFLGATEEILAEGGTAAWQYISEIDARIAGGDAGARFDINEFDRRVKDAASAGLMMGGLAGFGGGLVGGAARAYMASFHQSNIEGKKIIEQLTKAVTEAPNATDRQKAMERLQAEVKKRSGAQSALSRAYFRMSESNPEVFEKVATLQGKINALAHQHKTTSDPEVQKAIFQEVKALIEEKQKLENEAFEGDTTFEEVYKKEAESVAKERGYKSARWKSNFDSDPERLAEKAVQEGIQNQIDSLEAAKAVNSPEQNTDDDAQDQQGETQEDVELELDPEYIPSEGDTVKPNADGTYNPTALGDGPLSQVLRDVSTKLNNLVKAFAPMGINTVVHTNNNSFFQATGEKSSLGFFRDGKTVHINLEALKQLKEEEAEDQSLEKSDTIRHEFIHAAFRTLSPQQKQQFLEELSSIKDPKLKALIAQIKAKVDAEYGPNSENPYTEEQLIEEKAVTILEYLLDNPNIVGQKGAIQKALEWLGRIFGFKPTESDLQGFVNKFREAEASGAEFSGELVSNSGNSASRDLGMRKGGFKSTAYPDLLRKKVTYVKTFINKIGAEYQLYDEVFVNDYWHFRNWWIKETGNGKRGSYLSNFTYVGENGKSKKINPPRPKVDKSTGEVVDMEPKLQTPFEMKFAANQRAADRRNTSADRDGATESLVGSILEVVGLSKTGTRKESRTELFIDSRGSETESKSDLPVVFSDTIFTEGLRNMQFQNEYGDAVRSTMEDFAFLVPKDQAGEFAYSIRNNGDGSVTIDAHSDVILVEGREDGASLAEGEANPQGQAKRKLRISKGNALGKEENRGDLQEIAGLLTRALGFDRTKLLSGVRDLIATANMITAHKSMEDAFTIESQWVGMAVETAIQAGAARRNEDGSIEVLDPGFVGRIAVIQTLLSEKSTLGNPRVFKDIIDGSFGKTADSGDRIQMPYVTEAQLLIAINKRAAKSGNLTGKAKTLRQKLSKISADRSLSKEEQAEVRDFVRKVGQIHLAGKYIENITEAQFNAVKKHLSKKADEYTFEERTKIADALLTNIGKEEVYKKHNDSVWGNEKDGVGLGEVVAYTIIPFRLEEDSTITGFYSQEETDPKRPFKGRIEYEKVVDNDGNTMPPPETKIPDDTYSLAEIFPDLEIVTKSKKDGKEVKERKKVSELTPEEQGKAVSVRAGISSVKGQAFLSSIDTDNSTVFIGEGTNLTGVQETAESKKKAKGKAVELTGSASRRIGLKVDGQTELPFEPNNLNGFQAFMARMDQLFANKYANVMRLQKTIEKAKGKVVELSKDFINAEALLYGKTANDLEKLDGKVKDISLEMKDKGLNSEDVSEYLIARHAKERNAVISERTEGKDEAGSGMTNERADEIMNSLSPEKKAALESVAAKVDAITADTRKTMVEFGLEEKSTIDAFEAMFQNYVPLGGLALDEQNADTSLYPTGGAGMSVYGDTTKRARGRKSEAQNVLAQAIAQNAAVHAKARKNEALSSLYNLVKDNPNPKVWRLAKEVPFDAQSAVGVRVNGEQQFIVFANPDMAKSLKNMGVEKLDLFSKAMRRFSGFLRRSFTTANPEFIISNFARDIQSALFNAMAEADIPGGQIPGRHIAAKVMTRVKQTLPALLKNAVGKDLPSEMAAYFEEFKEDGGQTGWGFVKDVGTIAAEIESEINEKSKAKKASEWMAKNSIDVIENVNDAFENSVRLAAYIEARKAGVSREKAAELSKNITVNFNRSGELGPMANAWYMFFNASVQGTVRLARSLGTLKDVRKPNGELDSWFNRLNGAQKMAFGLSLTTGMLTMINIAMSDDDEDGVSFYEKIPDYEKERNLIIMYSGKNYFKIPLPYGFNVFANMGTSMVEAANGQREPLDAGMFLLNSAFSSFSPISFGQSKDASKYLAKGLSPTILKPFVDIAVNETYFGSSVYREQFPVGAPKPQAEMSYRSPEGVRSFFQWMNEVTGGSEQVPGSADFNPDKFWYGFEYYIGGAGQFITRSLGTGKDLFETIKEGEKVPMKANDFPFLRKLYGEASKYYDSDTYTENANLVSQLYKERKEAEDKNDKRYKGVMKLESARKSTEKKIKRLRKLRKEARDIENYVEKQNRIYELYEKERSLLMQFNKQYEQLRGKN